MLDPLHDLDLWLHTWLWLWIVKKKFLNRFISIMVGPFDVEWWGMDAAPTIWPWLVTSSHDPHLGFQRTYVEIAVSRIDGSESFEFVRTKAVNRCVGKNDDIYIYICFPPSRGILNYLLSAWCSLICNYFSLYVFAAAFTSSRANRFWVAWRVWWWVLFKSCWFPCKFVHMVDSQETKGINATFRESALDYCPW